MITRNEKAKGLWWRLLATLPVLAILMIANTKVVAQEQKAESQLITVEMGQFEIFDDDGFPMQLKDTVIYNEDGTYVKFETSDAFDPMTGEPRKKMTITTHDADGTNTGTITSLRWQMHGDTTLYTAEPFSISADKFRLDVFPGEDNPAQVIRNSNDSIYNTVEQMPQFPGGDQAMFEYLGKNIKYPEEAKEKNVEGRVFISFVVEKDGSVTNVEVKRSIGGGCDEEAVRVVKAMPKWNPGKQKGEPVRVSYMLPIFFKLTDKTANATNLANTSYMGKGTGKKDGTNYTMEMTMEFESEKAGYFVMTLTANKEGQTAKVFEDVGLPFVYTYDGKKIGAIQPTNPDGSQLGEEPLLPYAFLVNKDGSISVSFYDLKEDIGVEEIVFKKVTK